MLLNIYMINRSKKLTTYELSISTKYVPDWGIKEGIREILQNAIDANTQGCKMEVKYDASRCLLKVSNKGVYLAPSSLLMGETDKTNKQNQIGQFGEGYKLGSLALLRQGKRVSIFNRCTDTPQRWEFDLVFSTKYNTKLMVVKTFNIKSEKQDKMTFQINGITPEEWNECKNLFLEIGDFGSYKRHTCLQGEVLDGDFVKGCLFVGGIFIQKKDNYWYGYNFTPGHITLNRDRTIIDGWSLEYNIAKIWNYLGSDKVGHVEAIEKMLIHSAPDVNGFSNLYYCSEALATLLADRFCEKYGKKSHPITHVEQAQALSYANVRGIPCSDLYCKVLEKILGTTKEITERLSKTPIEEISIYSLDPDEHNNLNIAMGLVQREDVKPANVRVAKFASKDILGRAIMKDNTILVARKILKDFIKTLKILVHEYTHITHEVGDNDAYFHEKERELWGSIVDRLLKEMKHG